MTSPDAAVSVVPARERILGAAYELFSRRGIRAVGTDEVIGRAGVARLHDWLRLRDGYEGCAFINVLLEVVPDHPAGRSHTGSTAAVPALR